MILEAHRGSPNRGGGKGAYTSGARGKLGFGTKSVKIHVFFVCLNDMPISGGVGGRI